MQNCIANIETYYSLIRYNLFFLRYITSASSTTTVVALYIVEIECGCLSQHKSKSFKKLQLSKLYT